MTTPSEMHDRFMAWFRSLSVRDRNAFARAFSTATPEELQAVMALRKEASDGSK